MASIYNENGEQFQDLEISNVDGNIAGLSYVDASGNKQTISINLANVDITDPRAIAEAIAHETVDIGKHQANEGNAIARGSMVSAIMDMMNYGNANTNDLTTEQWLANNKDSSVLSLGNTNLRSNINNASSGNGTANALFREMGVATITTALKIAGVTGKEVEIKNSGEDVFATAGDAIYGIAGLNQEAKDKLNDDVKQATHAAEQYNKLDATVTNAAISIMQNPTATLAAIGEMPLNVLDTLNRNPLEILFTTEGYAYALNEYQEGYYLTAGAALLGTIAIDNPLGLTGKQATKTIAKETVENIAEQSGKKLIKETAEYELVYGSQEGLTTILDSARFTLEGTRNTNKKPLLATEANAQQAMNLGALADSVVRNNATDNTIFVIGRREDTAIAQDWYGYTVLNSPTWTARLNDEVIIDVIRNQQNVYVASPLVEKNLKKIDKLTGVEIETVTQREVNMLKGAGYQGQGDYLIPSSKLDLYK
jgi:hypothetical protein